MFSFGGESGFLRVGRPCPPMTSIEPIIRRVGGGTTYWLSMGIGGARPGPGIVVVTLLFSGPSPTPDSCIRIRF